MVNLDVENNLETIYRLAVTHNSVTFAEFNNIEDFQQTILLVEGENLSQVISFCNKYTVGKIILAFQCPERSNLSDRKNFCFDLLFLQCLHNGCQY